MSAVNLSLDISCCQDSSCHEREQCRRWLERESGTVHALSRPSGEGSGD